MANRMLLVSNKTNSERQAKINRKAAQLEASLMEKFHKYEIGEDVPYSIDSLGNKYITVEIGNNTYRGENGDNKPSSNKKTNDIYVALYHRMQKRGLVVCQKDNSFNVEAWLLIEQNQIPPESTENAKLKGTEKTKETKDAKDIVDSLLNSSLYAYTDMSLNNLVSEEIREMANNLLKNKKLYLGQQKQKEERKEEQKEQQPPNVVQKESE